MPKKIKFESFKYRFLEQTRAFAIKQNLTDSKKWNEFVNNLQFSYQDGEVKIVWNFPTPGLISFELAKLKLYVRGDSARSAEKQRDLGLSFSEDRVKKSNQLFFEHAVELMVIKANLHNFGPNMSELQKRLDVEREFHDAWADSEIVENFDVRMMNEVCTAPEMRYITKMLGDIKGKDLLDVGCGLGEASVYFAILGASVTSSDLSQGMLDATHRLAIANNVSIQPLLSAAEDLGLTVDKKFDIIYLGNLLHHVNIEETLSRLKKHLKPSGVFVSWDPVQYNPVINVYRKMAMDVRTPDEHPLRVSDINIFRNNFKQVDTKFFWLSTLIIFLFMALVQKRNPNKERFWKVVLREGNSWEWLYTPLSMLDRALLTLIPPLGWLCWNVVVIAKNPR
jgi:2-polyprenyl-3-methyl-5-hydroxy-6-metoxy-1,4-benzoquinol methylase